MLNLPIRVARTLSRKALYSTAMMRAVRTCTRGGIRILAYHRFPEDRSRLIAQCEHIRQSYYPVGMQQVAERFVAGTPLPAGALAVTVDDGYHDFLLNAYPVFSKYAIPVTIFLVTDFIDGQQWLWWDQIKYMFGQTRRASLQLAGGDLDIASDREHATHHVTQTMKCMPYAQFCAQLGALQNWLEVELPRHPPAEYAPLSWEEVRKLSAAGVECGVHTKTHPILAKLADSVQLREEIAGSKRRLEEELAVPSVHFCYPNGTYDDYTEQTLDIVKQCGFTTAVTAECGFNYAGADPFQLLRIGVEPLMPEQLFAQLLAGVRSHPGSGRRSRTQAIDVFHHVFGTTTNRNVQA